MAGLYLHIPFCKQACFYCDFHFSTDRYHIDEVIASMQQEMELRSGFITGPVETIYFGGGTPSLIPGQLLEALMQTVRSNFRVADNPEVTLEANPDDLSPRKLDELRRAGINRLSIGVQSFRDDLLRYLNRAHSADAARQSLADSRAAGFQNISIDLIYALPGLASESWRQTMMEALAFQPEHISAYALTIEDRTVFGHWQKKGRLKAVSEEEAADQFEMMQEVFASGGYEHYEISNFARPGFYSRHNTSYWLQEPYLGIGPSAHSYDGTQRVVNIRSNAGYTKAVAMGTPEAETELLTHENKINEYILTRLRTRWGCDLRNLRDTYSDELLDRCGSVIRSHLEHGVLTLSGDILQLTKKGMLVADRVAEDLMKG